MVKTFLKIPVSTVVDDVGVDEDEVSIGDEDEDDAEVVDAEDAREFELFESP